MKKLLGIVVLSLLWCNISYAESVAKFRCKDRNDIDHTVKIDLINRSMIYGSSQLKFKINVVTDERIISETINPSDGKRRTLSFDRYSGRMSFTSYHKDPPFIFFLQCRKLDPSKKIF